MLLNYKILIYKNHVCICLWGIVTIMSHDHSITVCDDCDTACLLCCNMSKKGSLCMLAFIFFIHTALSLSLCPCIR